MNGVFDAFQNGKTISQNMTLKRYAKNPHHLTLPEIKKFTALNEARCFRYVVKRCKASCEKLKHRKWKQHLKRCAKNLNHLTLPEINDFNALSDA